SSMKVASVTVPAITHGFTGRRGTSLRERPDFGCESAFGSKTATAVAMRSPRNLRMRPNGLFKHQIQKKSDRLVFFRTVALRPRYYAVRREKRQKKAESRILHDTVLT